MIPRNIAFDSPSKPVHSNNSHNHNNNMIGKTSNVVITPPSVYVFGHHQQQQHLPITSPLLPPMEVYVPKQDVSYPTKCNTTANSYSNKEELLVHPHQPHHSHNRRHDTSFKQQQQQQQHYNASFSSTADRDLGYELKFSRFGFEPAAPVIEIQIPSSSFHNNENENDNDAEAEEYENGGYYDPQHQHYQHTNYCNHQSGIGLENESLSLSFYTITTISTTNNNNNNNNHDMMEQEHKQPEEEDEQQQQQQQDEKEEDYYNQNKRSTAAAATTALPASAIVFSSPSKTTTSTSLSASPLLVTSPPSTNAVIVATTSEVEEEDEEVTAEAADVVASSTIASTITSNTSTIPSSKPTTIGALKQKQFRFATTTTTTQEQQQQQQSVDNTTTTTTENVLTIIHEIESFKDHEYYADDLWWTEDEIMSFHMHAIQTVKLYSQKQQQLKLRLQQQQQQQDESANPIPAQFYHYVEAAETVYQSPNTTFPIQDSIKFMARESRYIRGLEGHMMKLFLSKQQQLYNDKLFTLQTKLRSFPYELSSHVIAMTMEDCSHKAAVFAIRLGQIDRIEAIKANMSSRCKRWLQMENDNEEEGGNE